MDMMDNSNIFPPNVTLSSLNNSFLPSTNGPHLENNPMMMYSQHHSVPNQVPTHYFRQSPQSQQPTLYSNYGPPPPNQVAPGYYPMQQQQQRMSPANHSSPMNKRSTLMHSPRTAQQTNQQLQLHMSMNVTLPYVMGRGSFHPVRSLLISRCNQTNSSSNNNNIDVGH